MDWMNDALCRQIDPDIWTGEDTPARRHVAMNRAIKICRSCPVLEQCRDYAFTLARHEPIFGVWGGLRPREINIAIRGRHK